MPPRNASVGGDGERMAYLAGFFDGEGSIYPRNGLNVNAGQIDRRPLDALVASFGGSVKASPRSSAKQTMHYWTIYGEPAARALEALLPWLLVKRQQAEWALQYQRLVRRAGDNLRNREQGRFRRLEPEIKSERERLRGLIMGSRTGASTRREDRLWTGQA